MAMHAPHGNALAVSPATTRTDPAQAARARKAAQDFEAMAIGQFLQPIFDTVDLSASPFGGGEAEQAWKPLLVNEMAKQIATHGGIGLAAPVLSQMLRTQEGRG